MKAMFSQPTSCHRKGADGCEVGVRENAPEEAGCVLLHIRPLLGCAQGSLHPSLPQLTLAAVPAS